MIDKIIRIFCLVDDFCKEIDKIKRTCPNNKISSKAKKQGF